MKKKKLIIGLMASCAILSLASCGASNKSSNNSKVEEGSNQNDITHYVIFTVDGEEVGRVEYQEGDSVINEIEVPKKPGYIGVWNEYTLGTADITVEATYYQSAKYYVYFYLENFSENYVLASDRTEELEGIVGEKIQYDIPKIEGFVCNKEIDEVVTEDGHATVYLYYDRLEYTVSFETKTDTEIEPVTYKYGDNVSLPKLTKEGYTFAGWKYNGLDFTYKDTVKSDMTLEANFIPNDNTVYTIRYNVEKLDGTYEVYNTSTESGTTDTEVEAKYIDIEGYTRVSNDVKGTILGDGSLVLDVNYNLNVYHVTYDNQDPEMENVVVDYKYGEKIKNTSTLKQGYQVVNYTIGENEYTSLNDANILATSDLTIKVNWEPAMVRYKVEEYFENYNGEYESKTNYSGKEYTNTSLTLTAKAYTGYYVNEEMSDSTKVISANGDTVFKIYYSLEEYTISFNTGTDQVLDSIPYKYNQTLGELPTPTRAGYNFRFWLYNDVTVEDTTCVKNDMELVAFWAPRSDTKYKVNIYTQNIDNDEYTYLETVEYQDVTNRTITISKIDYEIPVGFKVNTTLSENFTVNGDGSSVGNLYLDRKLYSLTIKCVTGTSYNSDKPVTDIKYGTKITFTPVYNGVLGYNAVFKFGGNIYRDELVVEVKGEYNVYVEKESIPELVNYSFTSTETTLEITRINDSAISEDGVVTLPDCVTSLTKASNNNTNLKKIIFNTNCTKIGYAALAYTSIEEVVLPEDSKLEEIGEFAFKDCENLTLFSMPSGLKTIGDDAFCNCTNFSGEIVLPSTIESIGSYVFASNKFSVKFTSFDNLVNLGESALTGATVDYFELSSKIAIASSLKNINFNKLVIKNDIEALDDYYLTQGSIKELVFEENSTLTTIGVRTFYNTKISSEVVLPASLVSIGKYAFLDSNAPLVDLNSCTLLQTIDEQAFFNVNVQKLYLHSSLVSIGDKAFYNSGLRVVSLESGSPTIGDGAFGSNNKLSIVINDSNLVITAGSTDYGLIAYKATTVATTAEFEANYKLIDNYLIDITGDWTLTSYIGSDKVVNIPDGVVKINSDVFGYAPMIKLIIPDSVTRIEASAFYGCSSLRSITLGKNVSYLGTSAFAGVRAYEIINYSSMEISREKYNSSAIADYSYVVTTDASYESKVTFDNEFIRYNGDDSTVLIGYIGGQYKDVVVPSDIDSIVYGFYNITLNSLLVSKNVKVIGEYAFSQLKCGSFALEEGSELKEIGASAFRGAFYGNEISLQLPNTLEVIGESAFRSATFTSLVFEEGSKLTKINEGAFLSSNLGSELVIPESVTTFGSIVFNNITCSKITIKGNVTAIPDGFANYAKCTAIEFTNYNAIETIGKDAFNSSSITSFTLGTGLKKIGDNAFYACSSLASITNYSSLTLTMGSSDNGYVAYYATEIITE